MGVQMNGVDQMARLEVKTRTNFTFVNNTNEQTAYSYSNTDGLTRRFTGSFDLDALVTGGSVVTVRVKEEIDGSNLRNIDEKTITVGTQPENFPVDYETDKDFSVTLQIDVAEATSRAIKRNVRVWKVGE